MVMKIKSNKKPKTLDPKGRTPPFKRLTCCVFSFKRRWHALAVLRSLPHF